MFQHELARALMNAGGVVVAEVLHSSRLSAEGELSEENLIEELRAAGTSASFIPSADDIVRFLTRETGEGDVVLVMSNGPFGGLHEKLLSALRG